MVIIGHNPLVLPVDLYWVQNFNRERYIVYKTVHSTFELYVFIKKKNFLLCKFFITDLHSSTISSCVFAPDDDKIMTTSMDKSTKFYDLRMKRVTITLQ